ncbi:MAG TPA: tetratricopeptide repeat protein [Burkholderiales bacterium]|nr:tetratricopeptide repeat protein [Burkholderiales bacterium]
MLIRLLLSLAVSLFVASAAFAQADKQVPEQVDEPALYDMLLGEIALQRGDYALASKTYLELAKQTRDPRVARRAVEIANQGKLTDLAIEAARTWQNIEPQSPAALQVLAALLISAKKVDEAEPVIDKLLSAEGVSMERGFLQLNRLLAGNPDKAANLRVVRSLTNKHANLPEAQVALAQAAALANDDKAAIAAARRAAEMRPEWELPAVLEAQVLQKRSTSGAAKRLGQFVEKNPGSREGRLNYARALILDKRVAEARKQFETLLAANPNDTQLTYMVGVTALQLKDYTVAEDTMKRLVNNPQYRDQDGARYILGQIAEEKKDWGQAIKWYSDIQDGEQLVPARLRTANAIAKQGKLDEARDFLHKVADENPGQEVQFTVAEAQLLREANRSGEAFELLDKALKADPDQPELLYDYALTAEKLERYDVLEANLKKLIEVRPEHAHAYNALGYSFAERNMRLPEARDLIEKALQLAPDDYFIIDSLGWVQYREGNLKGAIETLRRAYNGRPDAEIGAHLGEVLWVSGDRNEANRVWNESLKTAPDNETLLKTIKRLRK